MILQIQYCVDGTGDVMWRHVVFIWIILNMVFTSGLHFSSIPIAKFTKICMISGRSTNLHPSDNINSPQCCRCNNAGIKTTRRRKIIGKEEVMYFTHYSLQKKKAYSIELNKASLLVKPSILSCDLSNQKILLMWRHTRFSAHVLARADKLGLPHEKALIKISLCTCVIFTL